MKRSTIILILAAAVAATAATQPASNVWQMWTASNPASSTTIDHTAWHNFLSTYVVTDSPEGVNLVRYGAVSPTDKSILDSYVAGLESTRVTNLSRDEQRAYWINLYNALTVKVILDHYPVESIRDINLTRGLFSRGPWQAKLLEIEGEAVSLDDIEHRILRPLWQDPRIHYAVNCASMGCPNLQPVAYTAANTDELLDRGAREYAGHPRGATLSGGRLTLSSIYDWFSEDFEKDGGAVRHIASFADSTMAGELLSYEGRIRYDYDWSLNE